MKQDEKEIFKSVINSCNIVDGKKMLSCEKAFQLAETFGIEKIEITKICNKNSIRICKCQLGCFK